MPVGPRVCVQGAPTSPGIANALAMKLDRRLAGLARKHGFAYTRYADDLTFSGDAKEAAGIVIRTARAIIRDEGFAVNGAKTRVGRAGRRRVTGVTVNRELSLSGEERRRVRAQIHHAQTGRPVEPKSPHPEASIEGKLAYLSMLNPAQADRLRARARGARRSP